VIDDQARLTSPTVPDQLARLGFRADDAHDAAAAAHRVAGSDQDLARVVTLAERLRARIGDFSSPSDDNPLHHAATEGDEPGVGVLPLLALLVSAPEVAAFHAARGISEDISWASLADLGQQAWVHRKTYGSFGLHTYRWLPIAWSGALYWLGRLQFNLHREGAEWVLSTHIPATGPLDAAAVDASFRQATAFFAEHFPDYRTTDFHCSSWLLDPELAAALAPTSNLARFQRRWRLYGEPMRGDEDVLFFTFFRRGPVDLDALPRDTSLQRAVVDRLRSGRHWSVWQGRIPQHPSPSDTSQPADHRPAGIEAHP
jgi:hypothetical protein